MEKGRLVGSLAVNMILSIMMIVGDQMMNLPVSRGYIPYEDFLTVFQLNRNIPLNSHMLYQLSLIII